VNSTPTAPPGNPPPGGTFPAGTAGESAGHSAEVFALKVWLRENIVSLIITAVFVALIVIYTDPIDTLKVIIGLGFLIFIHELGHFLAAKWCDVHVRTFSIGFGPAVPFCSYKWGETTYMVGIIPLGGYVSMVGEGDNAGDEDAEEDPRSFRHKSVGQRMLIISAGVIMNVLLGMACFAAAYLHGVREEPATAGAITSGGAAWRAGIKADDHIVSIGDRVNPTFKNLRPIAMSTRQGENLKVVIERDGKELDPIDIYPLREEGTNFPILGISAEYQLTLPSIKKKGFQVTVPGSPAAKAKDPGFEPGDRTVGMTDPETKAVTPFLADRQDPDQKPNIREYYRRMELLAGKPVTFSVVRKDGQTANIAVEPAYRGDLGMRMRMGRVAALREKGPAKEAGVMASPDGQPTQGDLIQTLKLPEAGGKQTWFTTGEVAPQTNVEIRKLDPILLPLELKKWTDRNPTDQKVKLVVLRQVGHEENKPVELEMTYDPTYRHDREEVTLSNSPVALGGLGLAYWVQAMVDEVVPDGPAARAGLAVNDVVTAVRFKALDENGNLTPGDWADVKDNQWAKAESEFQRIGVPFEFDLKVTHKDGSKVEVTLKGHEDKNWPTTSSRGLVFDLDFRTQKATDFGDALYLGVRRTGMFIREVYMNLSAMAFGRVSMKTMSGPLVIANVSYKIAGQDFWQFLVFLGMISVNLAVVNFLPIPILDGGHMVFLLLEWILGRPVPERVFAIAMYTGLALILTLMVFVLVQDGHFFGWF
jgi:regulator of sigma E protease